MKVKIDCDCITNGGKGNCLARPIKKTEKFNKCFFQKNHMDEKIMKGRHICFLSNECRKVLISYGKPVEYFLEHILPQIELKFEKYLNRKNRLKKRETVKV